MPSTFNPFGLKAKSHPSGIIRPQRWVVPASDITGNQSSWDNLYQDDAVYFDSNGRVRLTSSPPTGGVANCVGSFQGVEYADSNGRRTVSNQFNKTLISTAGGTSSVTGANSGLGGITDVWFWIYTDPEITYEIQLAAAPAAANGGPASGGGFAPAVPPFGAEGALIGYSQNVGSTAVNGPNGVVGFSAGFGFVPATPATGAPFIIYNLAYDNNPTTTYVAGTPVGINTNTWSDSYPNVLVRLAAPQWANTVAGF